MTFKIGELYDVFSAIHRAELTGNDAWRNATAQPWCEIKEIFGLADFDSMAGMVEKIECIVELWREDQRDAVDTKRERKGK